MAVYNHEFRGLKAGILESGDLIYRLLDTQVHIYFSADFEVGNYSVMFESRRFVAELREEKRFRVYSGSASLAARRVVGIDDRLIHPTAYMLAARLFPKLLDFGYVFDNSPKDPRTEEEELL